jgi:predicted acylesterase/phospholipase RssA
MTDECPFRILSLDGGGLRGLFTASFLSHVETYSRRRTADHFDLIAGTSTGAIIALGLSAGLPASEILEFYKEIGPAVFSRPRRFRQLIVPRHANTRLISALKDVFGERRMNDLAVPVCIPSYELRSAQPRVIKTDHGPDLHWGGDQLVWKVAAASAAAPYYLPSVSIEVHDYHIDGGIWANNPVMVAITEAMRIFGQHISELKVLSIGTGSCPPRLGSRQSPHPGVVGWAWRTRLLNVILDAQSQSAHWNASCLLTAQQYHRVQIDLQPNLAMDSYRACEPLIARGQQEAMNTLAMISREFLTVPCVPRQIPWTPPAA